VRRRRIEVRAVDGVSFVVRRGEMVGYLGPNGAGKSTTIKMLTGILTPSGGFVRTVGLEPVRQRTTLARRIGVVFGQRTQLWWDLPLGDSFELLHHVYRTERPRHRANLEGLVDRLDMGAFLATPVRQLSLGQRMRGEIAASLLHDPAVVVLDEPTIGLDVVSKQAVRDFLVDHNRDHGTTVLLTTHDLDDVERLCPRMMIIDRGRVIYDGGVAAFKAEHGVERTIVVDLVEPGAAMSIAGAEVRRVEGPRQWVVFDRRDLTAAEVVRRITEAAPIRDLSIEEPEIEELVRNVYLNRFEPVTPRPDGGRAEGAG
jgi:ABC-2 type transport system ATP-binding protein